MFRNKRRLVFLIGLTVVIFGVFCLVTGVFHAEAAGKRFEGKTIRFVSWTDESGKAAVEHIAKPFEAMTGAKVTPDLVGATSEMVAKVKASAAKPQFDVITLSMVGGIELANAGLLEKPDLSKLPNLDQVFPHLRTGANGYAVGYYLWCDGLVYNTKTFPSPPTTFRVMWDKKYAGRLFLPPPQWTEAMELTVLAAQMAGGSERNVEPGWKKLAELKGRVLTLGENPPQIAELFRADSLDLGGVYSPGLLGPKFLGNPEYNMMITMNLEEGFFYDLQLMIVPKGHPGDTDVIHAFMNYALDPVVQGKMAEAIYYGVINQNAVLSERAKKMPLIPSAKLVAEKGQCVDKDYLATVRQEWIKKFTEMFGM